MMFDCMSYLLVVTTMAVITVEAALAVSVAVVEVSVVAGISAIGTQLARHYPPEGPNDNELPDSPVLL